MQMSRTRKMRIVSYNIHGWRGGDGVTQPQRTIQTIETMKPDIVALQEVYEGTKLANGANALAYLSERLHGQSIAGPTLVSDDGYYGNVIITQYPVLDIHRVELPASRREPRGLLHVKVQLGEKKVDVINVHFGLRNSERKRQGAALLKYVQSLKSKALVLLGDLNEWRTRSRLIRLLDNQLGHSASLLKTFPAKYPLLSLDRMWICLPNTKSQVRTLQNAMTKASSDHLPLMADVCWDEQINH